MAKATNCNDKCDNYQDCKDDGVIDMFMPGATCPNYNDEESEAENG